jgi:hypothetical protein
MTSRTCIMAAAAATTLAATAANAAVTTYSNIGSWTSAGGAVITNSGPGYFFGSGISGDPTPLAFSASTTSSTAGTISGGGFYYGGASFAASGTGTVSGSGSSFTFTAGLNTSTLVFTVNTNLWAFALQYTTTAGASELYMQGSNNAPPVGQAEITIGTWMGVVNTSATINQIVITLNGGESLTITGAQYLAIPAPGAAALAGLAGVVCVSRRRRA